MANEPLYQTIYNYFYERIKKGEFKDGDQLPTEEEISKQFRVSRITTKRAMTQLANENLIERIPGRGSFVTLTQKETKLSEPKIITKTNKLIGVVLCDIGPSFGMDVLKGIEQKAKELGYHIIFKRSLDDRKQEVKIIQELLGLGVEGIIIQTVHGETYNPIILKEFYNGFPFVFVDRYMDKTTIPFVASKNYEAVYDLTKKLLDVGYEHIAFMSANVNVTTTLEQRFLGFQDALMESGKVYSKDLNLLTLKDPEISDKVQEIKEQDIESIVSHLADHPEIDCIFAAEYVVATMIEEAAKRLNKRIPDELGIVCFDVEPAHDELKTFTYIKQQQTKMGEKAVELLSDLFNHRLNRNNYKLFLETEVIQGKSSKPIK